MAQSLSQKTTNTFIKGLITEAGELTFPEGASVDELNCDLRRDGSRRRRLGVATETSAVYSSFTLSDTELVTTGTWQNVGGLADLEFLVFQKGANLYFYNKSTAPYSEQLYSDSISLATHEISSGSASLYKCQFASINGTLVVSSEGINTIVISFDNSANPKFTASAIAFKIRDFEWQGDVTGYETAATTSASRTYDTKNSGWVGTKGAAALSTWSAANSSNYPPLTHPWYAGKDSSNVFSASEWDKIFAGSTLTANGHYIIDFFNRVRSGLSTEVINTRFKSVTSFSGRVFYAGIAASEHTGTVLFSKVVDNNNDLGKCYQQNDPTAEYLSDLLATDGGYISIPDAINIQRLYAYQSSLFVFAENGVWAITGVDGVFSASSYGINRVSRVGILNPQSFVEAEGIPFWWSRFGIHTLTTDPTSGQGKEQNLTISTIQTRWDSITTEQKSKVTAIYDSISKKIYWSYPNAGETVTSKLNNFLILDLALQAFVPWTISDQSSSTDSVVGLAFYSGFGADFNVDVRSGGVIVDNDVLTASGGSDVNAGSFVASTIYIIKTAGDTDFTAVGADNNTVGTIFTATGAGSGTGVATTANDVVSTSSSGFTTGDPALVLLIRKGSDSKITMGSFSSTAFLDWGDTNYTSYAETGYDFVGDLVTKKNAPYIAIYTRLTEEGFNYTGSAYESIRPSSLLVSAAWDFNDTFSATQQAYRLKYPVVVSPHDLTSFPYPEDVIITRLKIRGHGRSVRLKYSSEQGKDFILLGWGIVQGRNTRF